MTIVRIKTHKPSPFRLHTTDRHLVVVDTQRIAHASWIAPRDAALMAWISTKKTSPIFANHHMVAPSDALRILPLPACLDIAADTTATKDDHEVVIDGTSHRLSMIAHDHEPLHIDRQDLLDVRPFDLVVASPATSLLVGVLESVLPLMEDDRRLEPGILESIGAPVLDPTRDLNTHVVTMALNLGTWLLDPSLERWRGNTINPHSLAALRRSGLVLCNRPWGPARTWRTQGFVAKTAGADAGIRAVGRAIGPMVRALESDTAQRALNILAQRHQCMPYCRNDAPNTSAHATMEAQKALDDLERSLRNAAQRLGVPVRA